MLWATKSCAGRRVSMGMVTPVLLFDGNALKSTHAHRKCPKCCATLQGHRRDVEAGGPAAQGQRAAAARGAGPRLLALGRLPRAARPGSPLSMAQSAFQQANSSPQKRRISTVACHALDLVDLSSCMPVDSSLWDDFPEQPGQACHLADAECLKQPSSLHQSP